jgi:hypothetical protein
MDEVQTGQRRRILTKHAERRIRERSNRREDVFNSGKKQLITRGEKVVTVVTEEFEIAQRLLYTQRQEKRHYKAPIEALNRLREETIKNKLKKKMPLTEKEEKAYKYMLVKELRKNCKHCKDCEGQCAREYYTHTIKNMEEELLKREMKGQLSKKYANHILNSYKMECQSVLGYVDGKWKNYILTDKTIKKCDDIWDKYDSQLQKLKTDAESLSERFYMFLIENAAEDLSTTSEEPNELNFATKYYTKAKKKKQQKDMSNKKSVTGKKNKKKKNKKNKKKA